ncbi:MAG: amidohydrolase family protein [Acidobacteriota bacterium]
MQRTPLLVWLGLCLLAGCTRPNDSLPMETTIVTGPRFWTGDPSHAWADGLLVSQGKIVRTVEHSEMARLLARGGTVLTLPGVLAVPGLVDSHAHLVGYAMGKREVELTGAATLDETLERIRSFAQQHPQDAWIVGRGWDQTDWPDKAWPNADQLQKIVSDRPAALSRVDGHAMWVNRAALASAKIDANTPDPPGGKIHRDAQGKPTGILIDNAITLVERQIPAPSDAVVEEALAAAANDLLAVGLVGVHDMGANDQLVNALAHLAKLNRWPLRVTGYASEGSSLHQRLLKDGPFVAGRVSIPGVKLYADGALGSRGARLLAPYADEPSSQGLWITEPPALQAQVEQLVQHGLQPAIHAIGDAANRAVLDAYQAAAQKSPRLASLRPRRARTNRRPDRLRTLSDRSAQSPRCNRRTQPPTCRGLSSGSAHSECPAPTPGVRYRAPARRSPLAATSRWNRSIRDWVCTPPSRVKMPAATRPADGCRSSGLRSRKRSLHSRLAPLTQPTRRNRSGVWSRDNGATSPSSTAICSPTIHTRFSMPKSQPP